MRDLNTRTDRLDKTLRGADGRLRDVRGRFVAAGQGAEQLGRGALAANSNLTRLTAGLGGAQRSLMGLGSGLVNVQGGLRGFQGGLLGLSAGLDIVDRLSDGMRELTGQAGEWADATNKSATAGKVFDLTLARFGVRMDEANGAAERLASKFGMSVDEVKDSMTTLIRAGFTDMGKLEEVMTGAAASAIAFGRDASDGFERVGDAAVTGLSAALNSIGISENLGPAFDQYAKSVNKTADALTQQEKAQVLANLVMTATGTEVEALSSIQNDYVRSKQEMALAEKDFSKAMGELTMPAVQQFNQLAASAIGTAAQMARAFAEGKDPLQVLAQAFPQLSGVVENLRSVWGALDPVMQQAKNTFGLVAGAFGRFMQALKAGENPVEALAQAFPNLGGVIRTVAPVLSTVGRVLETVREAVLGTQRPLDVLTEKFPALAGPIRTVGRIFEQVTDAFNQFKSSVSNGGGPLQALMQRFPQLGAFIERVKPQLAELGRNFLTTFGQARAAFQEVVVPVFQRMAPIVRTAMEQVVPIVSSAVGLIGNAFELITVAWKRYGQPMWDNWGPVVQQAVEVVGKYMRFALDTIRGIIGAVSRVMKGDWKGAWDFFSKTSKDSGVAATQSMIDMAKAMGERLGTLAESVKEKAALIGSNLKNSLIGALAGLGEALVIKIQAALEAMLGSIPDWAKDLLGITRNAMNNAQTNAYTNGGNDVAGQYTWQGFLNALGLGRATPSQGFGSNPGRYGYDSRGHLGRDYSTRVGTGLVSPLQGKIQYGYEAGGWGNFARIVDAQGRTIILAHLSEINKDLQAEAKRNGGWARLAAGTLIGRSGNTGNSTGPHVHLEVQVNGEPVDPKTLNWLSGASESRSGGSVSGQTIGFNADKGAVIQAVAQRLGISPNDLAAVISFETGGKFTTNARNHNSSGTGLIQFMQYTDGTDHGGNRSRWDYYGMSRDQFGALSFDQQMQYVERYLRERGIGQPGKTSLGAVYDAISGTGYRAGSPAYDANRNSRGINPWDTNQDGYIAPGEAVQSNYFRGHIRDYFGTGGVPRPAFQSPSGMGRPPAQPKPPTRPAPTPPRPTVTSTGTAANQAAGKAVSNKDLESAYRLIAALDKLDKAYATLDKNSAGYAGATKKYIGQLSGVEKQVQTLLKDPKLKPQVKAYYEGILKRIGTSKETAQAGVPKETTAEQVSQAQKLLNAVEKAQAAVDKNKSPVNLQALQRAKNALEAFRKESEENGFVLDQLSKKGEKTSGTYIATAADIRKYGNDALKQYKALEAAQNSGDSVKLAQAQRAVQTWINGDKAKQAVYDAEGAAYEVRKAQREKAKQEQEQADKEAERRDQERAQARARIAEALRQNNIKLAEQEVTRLEQLRDEELRKAGDNVAKKLQIEKEYANDVYNAQVAVIEATYAAEKRAAENGTDQEKESALRIAENNRTNALAAAEADRQRRLDEAAEANEERTRESEQARTEIESAATLERAENALQAERDLQTQIGLEREKAVAAAGDNLAARQAAIDAFADREIDAARRVAQAELVVGKRRNEQQLAEEKAGINEKLRKGLITQAEATQYLANAETRFLERNTGLYRAYGLVVTQTAQQIKQGQKDAGKATTDASDALSKRLNDLKDDITKAAQAGQFTGDAFNNAAEALADLRKEAEKQGFADLVKQIDTVGQAALGVAAALQDQGDNYNAVATYDVSRAQEMAQRGDGAGALAYLESVRVALEQAADRGDNVAGSLVIVTDAIDQMNRSWEEFMRGMGAEEDLRAFAEGLKFLTDEELQAAARLAEASKNRDQLKAVQSESNRRDELRKDRPDKLADIAERSDMDALESRHARGLVSEMTYINERERLQIEAARRARDLAIKEGGDAVVLEAQFQATKTKIEADGIAAREKLLRDQTQRRRVAGEKLAIAELEGEWAAAQRTGKGMDVVEYTRRRNELDLAAFNAHWSDVLGSLDMGSEDYLLAYGDFLAARAELTNKQNADEVKAGQELWNSKIELVQKWGGALSNVMNLFGANELAEGIGQAATGIGKGMEAYAKFSAGDIAGGISAAVEGVMNLGNAIDNFIPGIQAMKKEMAELAAEQRKAAGSMNYGGIKNPFYDELQKDAEAREKRAKGNFFQRMIWDLFGGGPQVMEKESAKFKSQAATIFGDLAQTVSGTLESSLMNAFESGDWAGAEEALDKSLSTFMAKAALQTIIEQSRLSELMKGYADARAAGQDGRAELEAIRAEMRGVQNEFRDISAEFKTAQHWDFKSGIAAGIGAIFEGADPLQALKDNLYERIKSTIVEGVMVKRYMAQIQPYLDQLGDALGKGLDPAAITQQLAAQLPGLSAQLQLGLGPIVTSLQAALGQNTAAIMGNTAALKEAQFQQTTIVNYADTGRRPDFRTRLGGM
ncbi:peptidoglycan DD-metalloendopeptidase family protein [Deinococcus sp. Marseille-Q6407]|uniref:peptidoglycan DD-metalloendopeptidase family protein n=1 Tax=Deinococcus sp. Marseille-Q6407 TaxID=2969223 RepID=UPI0021BE53B7|nr:peptidoglycan DD-metalloendopeptidase family protein [Deinococcus sp. Marseille-Q6407]